MNANTGFPMSPVLIDGFPVYGFRTVQDAAGWILNSTRRPNIAIALNAEKIITSRNKPEEFRRLKEIAFFYPDGAPVVWLLKRRQINSKRIPGVELWEELMRNTGDRRLLLIGASEEVNKATAEKVQADFGLTNVSRQNGYFEDEDQVIRDMVALQPDIVSVALGSPRQEAFMARASKACPNTFFMGVGGTYDVFVGRVRRAPVWLQNIGMEWLYRTVKQPTRIVRDLSRLKFLYLYLTKQV